ncbi:MFS transporter [Streptosporangiaceae bacterium NEAU-GS5]|nr:MFS transporter [Streptosporangiaceae bacterium NEAU-GS5]
MFIGRAANGPEHLTGDAQVERGHVFQSEDRDAVRTAHGLILSYIGSPATRRGICHDRRIDGVRLHRAWIVAGVALVAIIGAAGFRATPGVFITPLQDEFGWSTGEIGLAVSVNLTLFGLTAPFAAALMDRFGMRRVVAVALALVAAGSGVTVFMTASWQLVLCWGVLVGLGTGSMALVFVATVTDRWFVRHRGLVTGILTAGGATGQLIFLPVLAQLSQAHGWRSAALTVMGAALAVVPLVWFLLRDTPQEIGLRPYGATEDVSPPATLEGAGRRALRVLREAARTRSFWYLAGGFAICGASTNGLVGTHFIPAAHDHGMPEIMAASLLAVIGVFDIAGTVASGWLSDRIDPRRLLGAYYALRGASLLVLPQLFAASTHPSMLIFIIFYGLDWVATVPPTVALCRRIYGRQGAVVFGWVFASHQVGAAFAATLAGLVRDHLGNYDLAWYVAGALCVAAALMSLRVASSSGDLSTGQPSSGQPVGVAPRGADRAGEPA